MRLRANASFGVAVLLALGGCLNARPESYVPEGPGSGMPGDLDSGIPENPDGGLADNPDSGMLGNPDSGMPSSGDTGPRIICSPEELDFGLNAVGITSTLSVFCTNAGQFVPGHPAPNLFIPDPKTMEAGLAIENEDQAFQPFLDQPVPTAGLAPGETVKINVTYAPTAAGSDADTLIISSSDSAHPTTRIALTGTAKTLPICDFTVNPSSGLAFGHVDRGSEAVMSYEIVNNGTDACGPITIDLSAGSCPDFSLIGPSGPTTGFTIPSIAAGASYDVQIRYAPTTRESACNAGFCVDTPTRHFQCVQLTGSSNQSGCLLILPNPIDFGTMTFDQATGTWNASAKQTVTIRNICDTQDVNVNSISVVDPATNQGTPQPEFIVTGDPSPVTVPKVCPQYVNCPPTTPVEFQVSFDPYASGPDTAQVKIFTSDLPDPYLISLKGNAE